MSTLLEKLYLALGAGIVLVMLASFGLHAQEAQDSAAQYTVGLMTFLHVISAVLWIGLLWYFNIVQIPTMPTIPAELKPGVSKFIAPRALFWFRYGALATVVTGLTLSWMKGYLTDALTLSPSGRPLSRQSSRASPRRLPTCQYSSATRRSRPRRRRRRG